MQSATLHVQIDMGASPDEVRAVEEAFRRVDLEASVQPGIIELSEQFTWIVMISIPPTAFLTAYFAAAGGDAWKATKRLMQFVRDLKTARGGSRDGRIELEEMGRTWLLLSSDLPNEAFRQLEDVDWSVAQSGSLYWDSQGQCWMHSMRGKDPQQVSKPQH